MLLEAFLALTSLTAEATQVFKAQGEVTFDACSKPVCAVRIAGTGGKVWGELRLDGGNLVGTLTVKLKDLTTDNSLRDSHMHEKYLESAKYPEAKLTLTPSPFHNGTLPISGVLTLKGEGKPAKGSCAVKTEGSGYAAECELKVSLSDYPAIGVPSYAGVTVAGDVTVKVSLKAAL